MERSGMSSSGLGRLLGDRALGSRILRGERKLSKEHIRRLCDRFHVSADLFFR
jgi:antitoxin component HigA of HigAB toxin-antitoxin module